jgi:hypothetical protein
LLNRAETRKKGKKKREGKMIEKNEVKKNKIYIPEVKN